ARLRALIEGKASPARGDSYVLQIGAFSDAGKAAKLVDELRARGFPAYTERAGNVTRVRVGPVAGRAEADAAAARLKSAGHPAVLQAR
ncbi:MAG: SPOR domain-containing protein, partial [Thauera sp.]